MEKRNRSFYYKLENIVDLTRKTEYLKTIKCKTHIISMCEDQYIIEGIISFNTLQYKLTVSEKIHNNPENIIIEELDRNKIKFKRVELYKNPIIWDQELNKERGDNIVNAISAIVPIVMEQVGKIMNDNQNKNQETITEITKMFVEKLSIPQINNTTNTTTNNNNNNYGNVTNNKININQFLNTYCKDAISLEEAVKDIEFTTADILYLRNHSYTDALCKVLNRDLIDKYDVYTRPIHCTDQKPGRETMHVKNKEGWIKDQEHLKKQIHLSGHKQLCAMMEHLSPENNPRYHRPGTTEYEDSFYIRKHALASLDKKEDAAIINNLAKKTYLQDLTPPKEMITESEEC